MLRRYAAESGLAQLDYDLLKLVEHPPQVEIQAFPPSKMDLVSVRRSFMGKCSFDIKKDGFYYRTFVEDSTIGYGSHFRPDVRIVKALIRPFTLVNESVVYRRLRPERRMGSSCGLFVRELISFVFDILLLGASMVSVAAGCMVWIFLWEYVSFETCLPICAASLAEQGFAWNFLYIVITRVRFVGTTKEASTPFLPYLQFLL